MCEYCNCILNSLYKDNEYDVLIMSNRIKILNHKKKEALDIEINYCPICGEKIDIKRD